MHVSKVLLPYHLAKGGAGVKVDVVRVEPVAMLLHVCNLYKTHPCGCVEFFVDIHLDQALLTLIVVSLVGAFSGEMPWLSAGVALPCISFASLLVHLCEGHTSSSTRLSKVPTVPVLISI